MSARSRLSWEPRPPPSPPSLLILRSPSRKDVNMAEFAVAAGDQAFYRSEDIQLGEVGVDARARPGLGEA